LDKNGCELWGRREGEKGSRDQSHEVLDSVMRKKMRPNILRDIAKEFYS
jgi:hypothetical protein